jgi:hypothetical protein
MAIFSKVSQKLSPSSLKKFTPLPNRFVRGGFQEMGAVNNPVRTNTASEIKESIIGLKQLEDSRYANAQANNMRNQMAISEQKSRDIAEFIEQMNDMPPRHLSLAQDVIDLSDTRYMVPDGIFAEDNFNAIGQINSTGKKSTLMGYILNKLPQISKEKPEALDLADKVLTHSDSTNAKFFLFRFLDNLQNKGAEQMKATEPFVEMFSRDILNGSPSLYFDATCKENQFLNAINNMTSKDTKLENIQLFDKALKITDKFDTGKTKYNFAMNEILGGKPEKISENLEVLPDVLENASNQVEEFDVSGFLTKNINLD